MPLTATVVGCGGGSDFRPTDRDSRLRKPSPDEEEDDVVFVVVFVSGAGVETATIGSPFDDEDEPNTGVFRRPWNGRMRRDRSRRGQIGRHRVIGHVLVDRGFAFRQLRSEDRMHAAIDAGARARNRSTAADELRHLGIVLTAPFRAQRRRCPAGFHRPGTARRR